MYVAPSEYIWSSITISDLMEIKEYDRLFYPIRLLLHMLTGKDRASRLIIIPGRLIIYGNDRLRFYDVYSPRLMEYIIGLEENGKTDLYLDDTPLVMQGKGIIDDDYLSMNMRKQCARAINGEDRLTCTDDKYDVLVRIYTYMIPIMDILHRCILRSYISHRVYSKEPTAMELLTICL